MVENTPTTSITQLRNQLPVFGPLLLFVLPLPLFPAIFIALARGNAVNFLTSLAALGLLGVAGWSIRRGLKREVQIQRLGWSRQPSRPWKALGSLCAGLATGLCSWLIIKHSPLVSACVGLMTVAGAVLSYGVDSFFSLRRPGRDPLVSRDREVAAVIDEARIKIDAIDQANRQIHNPELNRRIRRINARAVDILSAIADDPATMRRARKLLKVYLDGAQRVIEGYASTHQDQRRGKLDDNFRNVLITIEDTFTEQYRNLLEKDALDLDIQIEVLTTQLKNEGVI